MQVTWEKYKDAWVGFDPGTQRILCAVGKSDGAPCEMYAMQLFDHMYLTAEAAKADAEKHAAFFEPECTPPVPFKDRVLSFLQAMTRAVEAGGLDVLTGTAKAPVAGDSSSATDTQA